MNKFWAKVKFTQDNSAELLITAFFKNFNPASSIEIRGYEAKMEIVFNEAPMEIIDVICDCEVLELHFGKNLKEYKEDNSEQENPVIENPEQPEQENPVIENPEQPALGKEEPSKKANPKIPIIPELETIAQKASSFEDFAKLVSAWMKTAKRQKFFENLVIVSAQIDNLSWKKLLAALKDRNISYSEWDKVYASRCVSEKFIGRDITILPFLNATRQYRDYSFTQVEEPAIKQNISEELAEKPKKTVEKAISNEIIIPTFRMECIPENKEFERVLASVDKTQPVEDRIRYVLKAMGLSKLPIQVQNPIVEIATSAVSKEKMSIDDILEDTNIPIKDRQYNRLTFTKLINDFVESYAPHSSKVQLLTFLSELQRIIM